MSVCSVRARLPLFPRASDVGGSASIEADATQLANRQRPNRAIALEEQRLADACAQSAALLISNDDCASESSLFQWRASIRCNADRLLQPVLPPPTRHTLLHPAISTRTRERACLPVRTAITQLLAPLLRVSCSDDDIINRVVQIDSWLTEQEREMETKNIAFTQDIRRGMFRKVITRTTAVGC